MKIKKMNLVIIEKNNNSDIKSVKSSGAKGMTIVKGEYLIERIIRIGRANGIKKVFCIINSNEPDLEKYLSKNKFGIPVKLIMSDTGRSIHILFALASVHNKEPFFVTNINSVFTEREFMEFVTYSLLHEDADGVLAVTRHLNDKKPVGVAMDDEDIILKFNNSKEGYSWFNGGIYYFSPQILNETRFALESGIPGIEEFLQLLIVRRHILKGFSFSKIINVENGADIAEAEDLVTGNNL